MREKFEALNRFVTERQGWITSSPGDIIRIEASRGPPAYILPLERSQ